jgi:uncharacterized protein YndB with AHSA1/START domain
MSIHRIEPYLEPLRKSVTVARPVSEAFEVFTAGIARWWPLVRYSISQARATSCGIEPFVGGVGGLLQSQGRAGHAGAEGLRILVFEPPTCLSFTWNAPPDQPYVRAHPPVR